MHDKTRTFEMLEEARAEARALVSAFDETRNVGDYKGTACTGRGIWISGNNAEMRFESGEWIRRNLRARGGNPRDQSGLSGVGKADEPNVREETEFEAQMALFAGTAGFVFARRLMPGLYKSRIAVTATTATATSGEKTLAGLCEIEELLTGISVKDDGADWNGQNSWSAGAAVAIGAFAVTSALGLEFTIIAIAKERVVVGVRLDINVAAIAAVAAGWAAARNVFFAAKGHAAVAAIAGFDKNFGFVSKHRRNGDIAKTKRGPSRRIGRDANDASLRSG